MSAIAVAVLFGLIVGSFLNVCIYRLPRASRWSWPASRCTSCGRGLAWFENVPVVELAGAARPMPDLPRADQPPCTRSSRPRPARSSAP